MTLTTVHTWFTGIGMIAVGVALIVHGEHDPGITLAAFGGTIAFFSGGIAVISKMDP